MFLFYFRGLTLEEALAMLEDDDFEAEKLQEITIFPPDNATGELTDEDSGDEDIMTINNLPGSQLKAPTEIVFENDIGDDFSSEDDVPLSQIRQTLMTNNAKRSAKKKIRQIYQWVKDDLRPIGDHFDEEVYESQESPQQLFLNFFDEDLIQMIVTESNRYAQQRNRKSNIENFEVKSFIGVLLLSGYVQVPRRRMLWEREQDTNNTLVAESISRDRFEYILSNVHFADNTNLDQSDKFAKVKPLFDHLKNKFIEYAPVSEMHSIDEAMVPYFGRHGCKQFIHNKPIRYGYKLWVGSNRVGYINWFEPYQGSSTNISETYSDLGVGAAVVLEYADVLCRKWPNKKFHLFFDNFFTSVPLIERLSEKNLSATGTVRENRLFGNSLTDSKELKRQCRGVYDYQKVADKNIIAVKWHDNNVVCLCSNAVGVEPVHTVKRYSRKERKNIQVMYENNAQ